MASILLNFKDPTRFVRDDLALLSLRHDVDPLPIKRRLANPFRILASVRKADLLFCWFASWHSLLPTLFASRLGRPIIVVTGGYDAACLPDIGYGHQRGGVRKIVANMVLRRATLLVVPSNSARREVSSIDGIPETPIRVIPQGFRVSDLSTAAIPEKEGMVLTVGGVDRQTLERKGIRPFVETARLEPNLDFVVVGKWRDSSARALARNAPENVELTGFLPDDELQERLRRASVYVQASRHESFGMAVAEAMLAGCIPVVSDAGSLPEVVGGAGIIISSVDPPAISGGIRRALTMPPEARRRARDRIIETYPFERRERLLLSTVQEVLNL